MSVVSKGCVSADSVMSSPSVFLVFGQEGGFSCRGEKMKEKKRSGVSHQGAGRATP